MTPPQNNNAPLKDLPHNAKPSVETLVALVRAGSADKAKMLAQQCDLHYQHPELIEAGVTEGIQNTESWLAKFITQNKQMLELKRHVRILAPLKYTVLIQGNSGTGKELIARALTGNRTGPFIALNCAGMPEHLIESELFGHSQGAFTDAKQTKKGLMLEAQDGVLFLDEIGDLNINVQAKFLRALQERTIRPVGSNKEYPINCRIIAATHWNLQELVDAKRFRLDLFARLSKFILKTTPLSERKEDILPIIRMLCNNDKSIEDKLAPLIDKMDLSHNVRSLENIVDRLIVLGVMP